LTAFKKKKEIVGSESMQKPLRTTTAGVAASSACLLIVLLFSQIASADLICLYMHVFTENRGGIKLDYFTVESEQTDSVAMLDNVWYWMDAGSSMLDTGRESRSEDRESRWEFISGALSYGPANLADTSKEGLPGDDAGFPEIEVPPAGPEHECVVRHVMVYDEPGRYAGWPANGGFWIWGDEMAVAFECGWFKDRPDWQDGHARDGSRGNEDIVARSSDAGLTWTHKKYDIMSSDDGIRDIPQGLDFGNPGFGFKCQGERFYYTYDRGKSWSGPYRLRITGLSGADENIESHTCYIINGKNDGYFFFGVEPDDAEDRFYCTRTMNGGKSFEFLGWISPPPDKAPNYERWAVYSAVMASENHLIAALRRKINKRSGRIKRLNWIDVYESKDSGRTWSFLSKVADTDVPNSDFNGNPPSLLKLTDGRLCVTYGFRGKPCVMCAKFSADNGKTWSEPVILRTGARNWDFGYSRSLQRRDGKVVTVYYFATPDNRDQFITATIWDPSKVK